MVYQQTERGKVSGLYTSAYLPSHEKLPGSNNPVTEKKLKGFQIVALKSRNTWPLDREFT